MSYTLGRKTYKPTLNEALFMSDLKRSYKIIIALLLGYSMAAAFFSLRLKSATSDEPIYLYARSEILTRFHWEGLDRDEIPLANSKDFSERRYFYKKYATLLQPPLSYYLQYILSPLQSLLRSPDPIYTSRVVMLVLIPLLGLGIFSWSRQLYGNAAGILSLVLFCFCPNMLAHARLITMDFILTVFFFFSVYALWKLYRSPEYKNIVYAGTFLGLASLSKYTGLMLLPIFVVIFLSIFLLEPGYAFSAYLPKSIRNRRISNLINGTITILILFGIALLLVNMAYGFQGFFAVKKDPFLSGSLQHLVLSSPIGQAALFVLPKPYVDGINLQMVMSQQGFHAFLMGEHSTTGWWYYFIVAFLIKTPIATMALGLLALYTWIKGPEERFKEALFLMFPALFLFVYFSFFNKINIGLRYVLPVYPFLFVFIGRVFKEYKEAPVIRRGFVGLMMAWYVLASWMIHPHYLAYFNEFIGGPKNGYRYLIDSNLDWGQDNLLIDAYIEKSPRPITMLTDEFPGPARGLVAINVNTLQGIAGRTGDAFRWLDRYKPIDYVGYTWLIYDIP